MTGWISGNPSLSAPGTFRNFTSVVHQFQALFPVPWSVVESRAAAIFRAPGGGQEIVVTTALLRRQTRPGPAEYHEIRTETLVVCGVTGDLITYAADPGRPARPCPTTPGSGWPSTASTPSESPPSSRMCPSFSRYTLRQLGHVSVPPVPGVASRPQAQFPVNRRATLPG